MAPDSSPPNSRTARQEGAATLAAQPAARAELPPDIPAPLHAAWQGRQRPWFVIISMINEGPRIASLLQRLQQQEVREQADFSSLMAATPTARWPWICCRLTRCAAC